MSIHAEVESLRKVPLFASIDTAKLKLLAFTSERLKFPEGAVLFHEGERGDCAYLLLSGQVDVSLAAPQGPVILATIGQHNIVGEMALLGDMPRSATVTAREPVEALRIGKEQFFQLLRDLPQMTLEIMRELALRLSNANRELAAAHAGRTEREKS
jgi:CRP/FNR family cyclic AMP-dependent transcriptional regulator